LGATSGGDCSFLGSVQDASTAASAAICGISSGVAVATRRLRTKKRTAATSRTAATTTGMMISIEAPPRVRRGAAGGAGRDVTVRPARRWIRGSRVAPGARSAVGIPAVVVVAEARVRALIGVVVVIRGKRRPAAAGEPGHVIPGAAVAALVTVGAIRGGAIRDTTVRPTRRGIRRVAPGARAAKVGIPAVVVVAEADVRVVARRQVVDVRPLIGPLLTRHPSRGHGAAVAALVTARAHCAVSRRRRRQGRREGRRRGRRIRSRRRRGRRRARRRVTHRGAVRRRRLRGRGFPPHAGAAVPRIRKILTQEDLDLSLFSRRGESSL